MFVILVFSFSLVIATCSAMFAVLNGEPVYLLFTVIGSFVAVYTFLKIRERFEVAKQNLELRLQCEDKGTLIDTEVGAATTLPVSWVVQSTKRDIDETAKLARPSLKTRSGSYPAIRNSGREKSSPGRRISPRKQQITEIRNIPESGPSTDFIFAAMCHEVRTPLNGVIGMIELLLDTKLSKKQRHITQTAFNSSQVLSQAVNDYVLFFRAQAGEGVETSTGKCNLEETILQVALLFQGLAYDKGLDLVVDIAEDVPRVVACDPRRLQQVIGNLTLNALKYTPKGEVCIGVKILDDTSKLKLPQKRSSTSNPMTDKSIPLEIYVSDSGPGLAPEEVKELFVPFRRLNSSKSTTGSGLGLTICKLIAKSMNASIDVFSELGLGTTFSLYFQPLELPSDPLVIELQSIQNTRIYGGAIGSKMMLLTYLEQLGIEAKEGSAEDLEHFDARKQVLEGIDLVFAFADPLGDEVALFYERSKVPVCRVRWLSDPKTFDCEFDYTLVQPFSRATLLEFLNDMHTSSSRLSTVDRWRSTFANKYPLQIVVAEDDPVSLELFVEVLEKLGFKPLQTRDGNEAVRVIRANKPDVAIVDMHMPGCTGLDVINRCSDCKTWWIVASAGSNLLTKENAEIYGYNDLLPKPLNIDSIRSAIQRAGEALGFGSNGLDKSSEAQEAPSHESHYDQMRSLYADEPEKLADLIHKAIEQTDEFTHEMTRRGEDPLAAEDVRRMAHTLRSSAAFAGAEEIAEIATRIDKEWESLASDQRMELIKELRNAWEVRDRHRLVRELNALRKDATLTGADRKPQ